MTARPEEDYSTSCTVYALLNDPNRVRPCDKGPERAENI
jgi:hypothetical protein